jgi:hypothetical protein
LLNNAIRNSLKNKKHFMDLKILIFNSIPSKNFFIYTSIKN